MPWVHTTLCRETLAMGESARKQADDLNARALMMGERARKQAVPSAITSEIFEIFPNFARVPSKVT